MIPIILLALMTCVYIVTLISFAVEDTSGSWPTNFAREELKKIKAREKDLTIKSLGIFFLGWPIILYDYIGNMVGNFLNYLGKVVIIKRKN